MKRNVRLHMAGMTLIELMIAMLIGIFIVGGAVSMFVTATDSRDVNEDISRMQENARYAMDALKADLRLSGLWGKTRELSNLDGYKGASGQLAAITGDCADRWYIDLENPIFASDDTNPYSATCLASANYRAGTDIVVTRHVATDTSASLDAGVIYLRADAGQGEVFEGSTGAVNTYSADAEDRRLISRAYYIRPYTFAAGDGVPSLRRLTLSSDGTNPVIRDEEVIPGIEDLQVQYGIDDNDDGSVNRYVDPDTAFTGQVLAVRIWIMARAPTGERGFDDANTYNYASKSVSPNDTFRRLLLSSTVQLRNRIPNPEL